MKCLICYKSLQDTETHYHSQCIKKVFAITSMPSLEIDETKLSNYAKQMLEANITVTGVQPKLSVWLEANKKHLRFTIVDNKSNFIIKPQSDLYPALPENEDLCMHLASEFGIQTAKHGLVKLPSGKQAYITKRFDRDKETKVACEDLCQLSEILTENKYRGSYEKVGKIIRKYSSQPGLDILHFFQLVLFSFITGNSDMHLKNFSMIEKNNGFILSPAYDLVSTVLVIKNDEEQLCLTVNGRKNHLAKRDFNALALNLGLTEKQTTNLYTSLIRKEKKLIDWVEQSFIPVEQKLQLKALITHRIAIFNP